MSDTSDAKIQCWRQRIDECRAEARCLSPEGQTALQSIIDSYDRLIALVQRQEDRRKG